MTGEMLSIGQLVQEEHEFTQEQIKMDLTRIRDLPA